MGIKYKWKHTDRTILLQSEISNQGKRQFVGWVRTAHHIIWFMVGFFILQKKKVFPNNWYAYIVLGES